MEKNNYFLKNNFSSIQSNEVSDEDHDYIKEKNISPLLSIKVHINSKTKLRDNLDEINYDVDEQIDEY